MKSSSPNNHAGFVLFNTLLGLLILASLAVSICCPCLSNYDINVYNAAGIACQVITALVCCIASMIGISFSIQDSSFFGIKIKDLRELRVETGYSLQGIMIIAVVIVVLNLVFFLFGLIVASFGVALVAVLFCIYIICREVPLMAKRESAALKILKSRIDAGTDASDIRATDLDDAIKYLIVHKNLKTTYEKLSLGSDETDANRKLLIKLLDLQTDIAYQLESIENKREQIETVDALRENLTDILFFAFDVLNNLGEESKNYTHYITRAIIGLTSCDIGKQDCTRVVKCALTSLDSLRWKEEKTTDKKDFLISILVSIFTYSVSKPDFTIMDAFQEHYSESTYHLGKEYDSSLLFFILSLYLYYCCELESQVPEELKAKLRERVCANESRIVDNGVVYSWKRLFLEYSGNHAIEYSEYMRVFTNNEHALEYYLFNTGAHWVVMDGALAFRWFVVNLLNCQENIFDDFSKVFGEKPKGSELYWLKKLYDDCYADGKEFSAPDYMQKMLAFYGVEKNTFGLFLVIEKNWHTLFDYLTKVKSQEIRDETLLLEKMDEKALADKIKVSVTETLQKEWGRDATLDVGSEPKYMRVLIEKANAVNFDEALIDYFTDSTFSTFRKKLSAKKLIRDESFDTKIQGLIKENIVAASSNSFQMVPYYIGDPAIQKQYVEKLSSVPQYHSSILPHISLVLPGGFSFNFIVDDAKVEKPNEEQINNRVERYKRADGQYVYKGTFMTRDDVFDTVKAKTIIITLIARFSLITEESKIIEIELFPKDAGGKEE